MAPSSAAPLVFHVSHVRVQVQCLLPEVECGMRAVWGAASRPMVPVTRHEHLAVTAGEDGFSVRCGARTLEQTSVRQDVLPLLEAALYRELVSWHAERCLLHAALITHAQHALLLIGDCNAGKSSLALAAVRSGYRYLGDELAVLHEGHAWGIARAVQFDPVADGEVLPAWLRDADRLSYRMQLTGARSGAVPLVALRAEQIAVSPEPLPRLHTVLVARGAGLRLQALPPLQMLAALHQSAFTQPSAELDALLSPTRNWSLEWNEPAAAIELLGKQLDR